MPYVPPGQPPLSSIPNPLLPTKDIDSYPVADPDPTPAASDIPTTAADHPSSPINSTSAPMLSSNPSCDLSDSLSGLKMDAPPTVSSPTSLPIDADGTDLAAELPRRDSEHSTKTSSSLPALDPHSANSASSSSIASSSDASSPGTTTGLPSPTMHPGDDGGREGGIARYREGLYAYTRGLYLEAKLSVTKEEKRRGSVSTNGFAPKQSGMERLAAKKALAKRLNAGNYERD